MSVFNTPDERDEIDDIRKQITKLHKRKDFKRGDDYPLHDAIDAIEFAGLKRVTGLDQYMTIEVISRIDQVSKLSIVWVQPIGMSIDDIGWIEVRGHALRQDGTVGVKLESANIYGHAKLKRRHIDGSWTDLPEPKGYLRCD